MAEQGVDREDRTEEATPQRREKAHEQGQLPRSRDLLSALTLLCGVAVLWWTSGAIAGALSAVARASFAGVHLRLHAWSYLSPSLQALVVALLPFLLATFLCAVAATLLQTGVPSLSWWKVGFDRLNPVNRLSQMFMVGGHGGWDHLRTLLKLLVVGYAAYRELRPLWQDLQGQLLLTPGLLAGRVIDHSLGVLLRLSAVLLAMGALDYLAARLLGERDLRMSKNEIRDELRQSEGDPQIKRRLRRRAREILKRRVAVEVPKADVVLVNPTHYAVALRYRAEEARAPRVTAKGVDAMALHIRALARDAGVPVLSNPPLARELHRRVPLGREVPGDLYKTVAEVLAFVYRVRQQGRRSP